MKKSLVVCWAECFRIEDGKYFAVVKNDEPIREVSRDEFARILKENNWLAKHRYGEVRRDYAKMIEFLRKES